MKTPETRPRFQSANRHYHRYRADNRSDWEEWIDPSRKTGSRRRSVWIGAAVVLTALVVGLLFLFDVL